MNGNPAHEDDDMFKQIVGSEMNSPSAKSSSPGSVPKRLLN